MKKAKTEVWAIIELMGHERTAGLIKTSDIGGLVRVEVPVEDGFRTEYYGEKAIYAIRVVSEDIARAYAPHERDVSAYDIPIVPRSEYEEALRKNNRLISELRNNVTTLQERLTQVNSLPAPQGEEPQPNSES